MRCSWTSRWLRILPSYSSPAFCSTRAEAWLSGWHVALMRRSCRWSNPNRNSSSAASVAYPCDQTSRWNTKPISPRRCWTLVTPMATDPISLPQLAWTAARVNSARCGLVACAVASARNARVSSMLLGPQSVNWVTSGSAAKACTASSSVTANSRRTSLWLAIGMPVFARRMFMGVPSSWPDWGCRNMRSAQSSPAGGRRSCCACWCAAQ